jgi:mannose-6-phosphate isomerase-like protein (cupin superfamily)
MTETPAPEFDAPAHVTLEQARTAPLEPGRASASLLTHGSLNLRWYAPRGVDRQTPHDRDEVYIVAAGTGWFVRDGDRFRFGPGDALFVPAGVTHRFEEFSGDFGVWVMFYGPVGGEAPR